MDCNKCLKHRDIHDFRTYKNGNKRAICKQCDNKMDKERKKNKRKEHLYKTVVQCSKCLESKALKDFAKLKKYDKKVCLQCYPTYLTECKSEWCRKESKKNINYRIKKSLAARLRNVLVKNDTTMNYIGCNISFLREWFEYNFLDDMNWNNYGTVWSIDHVIPVKHFDLNKENEKYKCWNWTNLVPLHVKSNSSKKSSIDTEQIKHINKKLQKFKEEGSTTKWFSEDLCILLRYSLTLSER
jgi:hypothetical protein